MIRRAIAYSSFAVVSFFANVAGAQSAEPGFALDRFEPAERGSEWFVNDSLDLRGKLRPAIGVDLDYAYRPLVIFATDAPDTVVASPIRDQLVLHAGAALNLWDRLRVAANMPIVLYQFGHSGVVDVPPPARFYAAPQTQTVAGDLRLGADVRLVGEYGDPATLAAGAQVFIPIGFRSDYTGDGTVRVLPHVLFAGDAGFLTYAARAGVHIRPHEATYRNVHLGTEAVASAAFGFRILDKHLVFGPEVFASTVLNGDAFDKEATPVEGMIGAHYTAGDFRFGLGGGAGLSRGYGSPVSRGLLSLEWMPRVEEPKAAAPLPPPPPKDTDLDGIVDPLDACPNERGVPTDDPASNGCPPPADRDHDGVLDPVDACPETPGKPTNDMKTNGCPDRDNDGVVDAFDACPDVTGVANEDPKKNGCPPEDPDRDSDGIPNDKDACPDEAGVADPDPQKNGCPKAFVRAGKIEITEQVKFKTASAVIDAGPSDAVLTAVAKVLKDHPEIKQIRVEGHTDANGSAQLNRTLSQKRAESVVKWLADHGIDKGRMTAKGFGPDKPIADNKTEDGRAQNRRVEFHID